MSFQTVFGLVVIIFLIILGFAFKNIKIISNIQIFVIWILMAFLSGGGDWKSHIDIFSSASGNNIFSVNDGGLYNLLCYLFKQAGMDFFVMNFCISTVLCVILYKMVIKNAKYPSICFALFLIYPFADNLIQKRFFLASVFALYGLKYLYEDEEKKYVKFGCACLLGGLIHTAAFAFVLYGIVFWVINRFKSKKWIYILVTVSALLIPMVPKAALMVFPESKINLYFYTLRLTLRDTLFWTVFHLSFVVLNSFMYRYIIKKNQLDLCLAQKMKRLEIINLSSIIYIPLYYFEPTFIRFFRNILIIHWCSFSYAAPERSRITVKSFLLIGAVLSLQALSFYMVYEITGTGLNSLIYPLFDENIVLKMLFR